MSSEGSCASICTTPPGTPILLSSSSTSSCRQPKTKKIMYDLTENDDFDREMIATYEEVAKLYPRPGVYRPVVLIGAPGVGRNELRRRLVARDPEKFRSPVPCKCLHTHNNLYFQKLFMSFIFLQTPHVQYAPGRSQDANTYLWHVTKWKPISLPANLLNMVNIRVICMALPARVLNPL